MNRAFTIVVMYYVLVYHHHNKNCLICELSYKWESTINFEAWKLFSSALSFANKYHF
jgi:hypothetical protein